MTTATSTTAAHAAREGARLARPWIEKAARLGYVAKGLLYVMIGALAFLQAFGSAAGKTVDSHGALREIHQSPFGTALLVAMTAGLAGHALWLFLQGVRDPEGEIRSAKHPILKRISFLGRGVLHGALVVYAVELLRGQAGDDGDGTKSLVANVMALHPAGIVVVAAVAAGIVAFALRELYRSWADDVLEKVDERLRGTWRDVTAFLARFGTATRAVVFALIGGYLAFAAIEHDPSEARGFASALSSLREWSFGWVMLAAAGTGLVAFGAYQLVLARHRRIVAC